MESRRVSYTIQRYAFLSCGSNDVTTEKDFELRPDTYKGAKRRNALHGYSESMHE